MSLRSHRSPGGLRKVLTHWDERLPHRHWHAGRTVGRTVYVGNGPNDLIGTMDQRGYASFVVLMRNLLPELIEMAWALEDAEAQLGRWKRKSFGQKLLEVLRGTA